MPPENTNEQALYIYVSESLQQSLNALKSDARLKADKTTPRMTYRRLMRRMLEEVSANDRLEEAIRSYFLNKTPDTNQTIKIKITQDEETRALASALAFRICGTGSMSEVCRLIIRYYVDHSLVRGLISTLKAEPKKAAVVNEIDEMPVPFVDSTYIAEMKAARKEDDTEDEESESEYVVTSFNLDVETVALLGELVKRMHVKYLALTSQLIEQYMADDKRYDKLMNSTAVLQGPPDSDSIVVKRFNFTAETDSLLEDLCANILASSNKSAMMRALIKVEAELQGIRIKTPTRKRKPRSRTRTAAVR